MTSSCSSSHLMFFYQQPIKMDIESFVFYYPIKMDHDSFIFNEPIKIEYDMIFFSIYRDNVFFIVYIYIFLP